MKSSQPTSLREAICGGNLDQVNRAIELGADLRVQDRSGNSLLHLSAEYGTPEIFKLLVDAGLDIHLPNKHKNQAIHEAAAHHQYEIVRICLELGMDPNTLGENGWPPLFFACKARDLDCVKHLLVAGAEVNGAFGEEGEGALFPAIKGQVLGIVQAILDAGAEINKYAYRQLCQ